jgi:hypothetical protein
MTKFDLDGFREMVYGNFTEETDIRVLLLLGYLEGELHNRERYESFLKSVIVGKEPFEPEIHTYEWFKNRTWKIEE